MNKVLIIVSMVWAGLPAIATAEPAAGTEVGKQTRTALELQRSGQAASGTERPMSGAVAERAYQRYLDSFTHPIPESFKDEEQEFVKGSE
jgi:hypothetical protein